MEADACLTPHWLVDHLVAGAVATLKPADFDLISEQCARDACLAKALSKAFNDLPWCASDALARPVAIQRERYFHEGDNAWLTVLAARESAK